MLKSRRRPPRWNEIRDAYLRLHPTCAACGGTEHLQVHRRRPTPELDEKNLITLCMGPLECHLMLGHGGSFRYYNPDATTAADVVLHHPERRTAIEFLSRRRRRA